MSNFKCIFSFEGSGNTNNFLVNSLTFESKTCKVIDFCENNVSFVHGMPMTLLLGNTDGNCATNKR